MSDNTNKSHQKAFRDYSRSIVERGNWDDHWQLISDHCHPLAKGFTRSVSDGERINENLTASIGVKSNRKMAAAMVGALWPSGSRSVDISPVASLKGEDSVRDFYSKMNDIVAEEIDDSTVGFISHLDSYMQEQGAFGNSAISVREGADGEPLLVFRAWSIKDMNVTVTPDGQTDSIFIIRRLSAVQVEDEFGSENLSLEMREAIKNSADTEFKIIQALAPRKFSPENKGNKAKPIMSLTFEEKSKAILEESGFDRMPIKVGKFYPNISEPYARSPAMDAISDVIESNDRRNLEAVAIEKHLDPPQGVTEGAISGNGVLDTSAGALNVFNQVGGLKNAPPMFQLSTVGELTSTFKRIEELDQSITEHFFLDRMLDFNNTSQMTLGEANLRNEIRAQTLSPIYARQITAVLTPIIEDVVSILFRRGYFGRISGTTEHEADVASGLNPEVVPEKVASLILAGKDFYRVGYNTPATRLMKSDSMGALTRVAQFAMENAQVDPSALDAYDAEAAVTKFAELSGSPIGVIRSDKEKKAIKELRAQQAQQQAQAAQQQQEIENEQAAGSK